MDKIRNINSVVSILRKKISERSPVANKQKTASSSNDKKIHKNEAIDKETLFKSIKSRIAKTDKKAANHNDIVMTIIAESIVTWEFGDRIMNDPSFDSLINNVIDSYKSEPNISNKIENILNEYS